MSLSTGTTTGSPVGVVSDTSLLEEAAGFAVKELHRRLKGENAKKLPDHVLKDYVKALSSFTERADAKEQEALAADAEFELLESLGGLPPARAAELVVGEMTRLDGLREACAARLEELVGEEEALRLLAQSAGRRTKEE